MSKITSIFTIVALLAGCTPLQYRPIKADPSMLYPEGGKTKIRKFGDKPNTSKKNLPVGPKAPEKKPLSIPEPPDPGPDEPDVGNAIAPIKKGDPAPFSGVIFSPKAAAEMIASLKNKDAECQLLVKKRVDECQVIADLELKKLRTELNAEINSCAIKVKTRDDTILFMDKKLTQAGNPNNELWFAVGTGGGFILGAALTVAATFAAAEAVK